MMDKNSREYWEWRATPDGIVKGELEDFEAIIRSNPREQEGYRAVVSTEAQIALIDVLNGIKRLIYTVKSTFVQGIHFQKAERIIEDWIAARAKALDQVELGEKARYELTIKITEFVAENDPDFTVDELIDPFDLF